MPKKIEKKAAAATASAGKKKPAKLKIELITEPEPEPKARKAPAKKAAVAQKTPATPKKSAAKRASKQAEVATQPAKPAAPPPKKKRPSTKVKAAKSSTVPITDEYGKAFEIAVPVSSPVADPIGDVSDGEGRTAHGVDVPHTAGESEAMAIALAEEIHSNEEPDYIPDSPLISGSSAPAKLERLQKILSQAGIASRRHAEQMIVEGRVMVNGQIVTELGVKADLGRDHIRVDGKLIAGAERHRYFVLNKPRGYVTTVSDPEGRPTVMQFFEKMHQRLYPVGRLDYLSEGLLLVTNDGELANQLTRAALGVEKTYLVKVAGRPTEEELDRLRSGVSIEREGPGSARVGTAPASIRQVRQGDNPWYEVVLIEGRNRELRKMFEQIGHFVEKIRRVGYGPLVLDVEPGKFRELSAEEVTALQLTAEGKLKPKRQRAMPTVPKDNDRATGERTSRSARTFSNRPATGRTAREFDSPQRDRRPDARPAFGSRRPERGVKPGFKPRFDNRGPERADRFGGRPPYPRPDAEQQGEARPFEPRRESSQPFRGRADSNFGRGQRFERKDTGFRPQQRDQRSDRQGAPRRDFAPRGGRPDFRPGGKPAFNRGGQSDFKRGDKPAFNRGGKPDFKRSDRPAFRPEDKPDFKRSERPSFKPDSQGPSDRGAQSRFRGERPAFNRGSKPPFERSSGPNFDRSSKPSFDRGNKPAFDRGARPPFKRNDRPAFKRDDRPPFDRSSQPGQSFESRSSRPPGRTFGSRPGGKPGVRPPGKGFASRPSAGKRSFSRGAGKPSFRPGGRPGSRPPGRKRG